MSNQKKMQLFQAYPISFLVTVVLPIITGIGLSIGGYLSLMERSKLDDQLNRIENNTKVALDKLPDLSQTIATMNRYENTLSQLGRKDEALSAVLTQYQRMNRAAQMWEGRRGIQDLEEKYGLASEVLDILSGNLAPVLIRDDLPSHPLIIGLGDNTFRVLFSVPMRIPPELEFMEIPDGSHPRVLEKSKYGFTVNFQPTNIQVNNFGFSADARL